MGQRVGIESNRTRQYVRSKNAAQALRLRIDVPLLGAIITLLGFGILMVFSASWDVSLYLYGSHSGVFVRQLMWLGIGIIVMSVLIFFNYRWIAKFVVPAMVLTIVLLIALLLLGDARLGSVRTVREGSIQPSELAKLVTILYLAVWLFAKKERLHDIWLGLVPLGLILGIVGGLILNQPDLSAALTIFGLGGMLFFLAGGDIKQIFILVVIAVLVGWFLVWVNPTGSERMGTYLPGLRDPLDASYHVRRSLGAFVNGGWLGTGISNGTVKLNDLPLPHSDSIFAVIGEELGFLGVLSILALYAVVLWRGVRISLNCQDTFGMLMASGITFAMTLQVSVNLGVALGLLPTKGLTLPFLSYGGTSLILNMACIGMLMNIGAHHGGSR